MRAQLELEHSQRHQDPCGHCVCKALHEGEAHISSQPINFQNMMMLNGWCAMLSSCPASQASVYIVTGSIAVMLFATHQSTVFLAGVKTRDATTHQRECEKSLGSHQPS